MQALRVVVLQDFEEALGAATLACDPDDGLGQNTKRYGTSNVVVETD